MSNTLPPLEGSKLYRHSPEDIRNGYLTTGLSCIPKNVVTRALVHLSKALGMSRFDREAVALSIRSDIVNPGHLRGDCSDIYQAASERLPMLDDLNVPPNPHITERELVDLNA